MSAIAIATFAAIALTVFVIFRSFIHKKGRYHVVAGTMLDLLLNFQNLHDYMTDLARKHKSYRLLRFQRSEVYTVDPVNVEYILKTNFANYGKVPIVKDVLVETLFCYLNMHDFKTYYK